MKISNLIDQPQNNLMHMSEHFMVDVLTGLCSTPKYISPKYFYDDMGSELFQKITQHQDYYLTRTECSILKKIKSKLPHVMAEDKIDIIELGPGDGHKSKLIIEGFLNQGCEVNYYPIDISEKAMYLLESNMDHHKALKTHGIVGEYFAGLRFAREKSTHKQLVLFLGSNIGNFNLTENKSFLRQLWMRLNISDYVFIGFDLKKDVNMLTAAYNDTSGYTRAFNLNLLTRINRELGGEFDINAFQHFGSYNPILGAMESYLLAKKAHKVYISELGRSFQFDAFEPIHLEYSYKFLQKDIDLLSQVTGFKVIEHFSDEKYYFIDSLWQKIK